MVSIFIKGFPIKSNIKDFVFSFSICPIIILAYLASIPKLQSFDVLCYYTDLAEKYQDPLHWIGDEMLEYECLFAK